MKLYFVRHFKTKGNYEKRYIGCTDEAVDWTREQKIAYDLPEKPDKLYSSPMKRCVQTAQMIYPGMQMVRNYDLREIHFGIFENKTYEELKDDSHYRKFIDGLEDPVDGEPREAFKERCMVAFDEIVCGCKSEETIVIVCHGGTIMAIMERLEENHRGFYDYQIPNGGVLECVYDNHIISIRGMGL